MSKGNVKTQGQKGSNMPYQLAVLELLGRISEGGGLVPVNYALESTQLLVKAAVEAIETNTADVATETTLAILQGYFAPVQRTPTLLRANGVGTVAAGARSVSVYNAGGSSGQWLGADILPGEQFTYSAGAEEDTLAEFTYDGIGTDLVITSVV